MKKKMSNRDKTFWAVVIPVVVLFFAFNTLPMIKGVIYSFTNYKGYAHMIMSDLETIQTCLPTPESEIAICLPLNMRLQEPYL